MNSPSSPKRQLEQLLQSLEDGCLTASEHQQLMDQLRDEPEAREAYIAHMRFSSLMQSKAESLAELGGVADERQPPAQGRQFARALMAAAALLAIIAFIGSMLRPPAPPEAFCKAGPGSVWNYELGGLNSDGTFEPDTRIRLDAGTLEIQLTSGSHLIFEGPGILDLRNPDEVHMADGRLWARAGGDRFIVHTDRIRVVDLGTEFGVIASTQVDEEVHVAEGTVRVEPILSTLKPVVLTAHQAIRTNAIGKPRTIPYDDRRFNKQLTATAPYWHWSFDRIENGGFPCDTDSPGLHDLSIYTFDLEKRRKTVDSSTGEGLHGRAFLLDQPTRFGRGDFYGIDGSRPRTVAFWVNASDQTEDGCSLVNWGQAGGEGAKWSLGTSKEGKSLSTNWGGAWATSPLDGADIFDGEWHHVAFVFTGETDEEGLPELHHYVDGQPQTVHHTRTGPSVDTLSDGRSGWPLTLGIQLFSEQEGPTYQGKIDELHVVGGALDQDQIRHLMEKNRLPWVK
ncbi:hypothetical protein HAHE_13640 [Haloferula helveola]|uniref:FecR protein n=1 Tax=Haloferula helveola TaxID=490095 RepID=A0ABM7R8P4_9BACT|nr:hypothetical protein HAHE_13640 [Haloferula helveola]